MSHSVSSQAFVTLATNDEYCKGAIVLAKSLKNFGTVNDVVVLITPDVSAIARELLNEVFDFVLEVNLLDSQDESHLALLRRPELGVTFTKIHCWKLTQYLKCVFLDADTMVFTNIDELFERDELSAVPDIGWPDLFNTGLFVYKPSYETFNNLIALADSEGSFDGGDQGLLNSYFSDWRVGDVKKILSYVYNLQASTFYTYNPAFAKFGKDTKVVHFIGTKKPWSYDYDAKLKTVKNLGLGGFHENQFVEAWWKVYSDVPGVERLVGTSTASREIPTPYVAKIGDISTPGLRGLASSISHAASSSSSSTQQSNLTEEERKVVHYEDLRCGNVDFNNRDSFSQIQHQLDQVMISNDENKSKAAVGASSCDQK